MDLDQLSQEEQAEYDQLTQEVGDHLGASRRHAAAGDDGRGGGGGGGGGGASERHCPDAEPGARHRQQGGRRDFRGNDSGRGGGPGMGGRGGPAAAAAAAAKANGQPDGPIKDVLTAKLKDLLCADNLERFRREPGSFRPPPRPPIPAEARSAAADAAVTAAGGQVPATSSTSVLIEFVKGDEAMVNSTNAMINGGGTSSGPGGGGSSVGSGSAEGGGGRATAAAAGSKERGGAGGADAAFCLSHGSAQAGGSDADQAPPPPLPPPQPLPMQPRAARPATFESHTREFGSRFLERHHYDGITGARENEYVATAGDKALAEARDRGGLTGGLGYNSAAVAAAAADGAATGGELGWKPESAPCDMDASLKLADPPKSYNGIRVEFPFKTPMHPQEQIMQRIVNAAKSGKHALLESPTGTGKSAASMSALLAWQRHELVRTGTAPQIIYAARTHTQVAQMAKEIKRLPYTPTIATLGSRAKLCINPMVVGDKLAEGSDDDDDDERGGDETERAWRGHADRGGSTGMNGAGGGAGGGFGGRGGSGARRGRRRRPRRPERRRPGSSNVTESCQALKSKVDHQRKHRKFLKIPGGESVAYDHEAPDLRLDLANIKGSLTDVEKKDAACPYYRSMSASRVAKLAHEFARPKIGLAGGSDGNHDIEDLRAFGRDPRGHTDKKRAQRERRRGGGGGGGGGGECGSGCGDSGCGSGGSGGSGSSNGGSSSDCAANQPAVAAGAGAAGASFSAGGSGASVSVTAGGAALVDLTYDTSDDNADAAPRAGEAGSAAAAAAAEGQEEQADTHLLACPYYLSHALAKLAQVVLLPYNYILDPGIRASMSLGIDKAVVIIDEAHNVEGVCRDAGSLELGLLDMVAVASDLCDLVQVAACSFNAGVLLDFVMKLLYFTARESRTLRGFEDEAEFSDPEKRKTRHESNEKHWACDNAGIKFWEGLVKDGGLTTSHAHLMKAMTELKDGVLNPPEEDEQQPELEEVTEAGGGIWGRPRMTPALNNLEKVVHVTGLALQHPHDYSLNVMSWDNVDRLKLPKHTRSFGTHDPRCPLQQSPFSRADYVPAKLFRFNAWLLTPSVVFDPLAIQTGSLILMSGTLSPLHSLRAELGRSFSERLLPFPQQALEANHVITPGKQLKVVSASISPNGTTLKCVWNNMVDTSFLDEIGRTVVALARHIPRGVLVFLPSYRVLEEVVRAWRASGVWSELVRCKGVVVEEPSAAAQFKAAKRQYETAIDAPGGNGSAVLLAVYRGKMSEGISFNDHYARGVLCVGIPFPSWGDPKVKAKRCYNSWKSLGGKPSSQDRGCGGARSWPEVCNAGDHGYGVIAPITGGRGGGGGLGGGRRATPAPVPARAAGRGVTIGPVGTPQEHEAAAAAALREEAAAAARRVADETARKAAVIAKKAALKAGQQLLNGSDWYLQEAFRALNQALGRCIRHIYDYGVICLIDERFQSPSSEHTKFLARWMRGLLLDCPNLEQAQDTIQQVFNTAPRYVQDRKARDELTRQEAGVMRREREEARAASAVAAVAAAASGLADTPPAGIGSGTEGGNGRSGSSSDAVGSGGGSVADAVVEEGHRQQDQPPATVTPTVLLSAGGHGSCSTAAAAAAAAVAAAGPAPSSSADGDGELPSRLLRTVLTSSQSPSLAAARGGCGTGDRGSGGSCSSVVAGWQGEASAEQLLASTALRGRHGRNCPASGGGGGGGGGSGDGGSDRPIPSTNSDRSSRRACQGPGEVPRGGALGGSAAGGEDTETREGGQEQEQEQEQEGEEEDEEEDEDSLGGADREVVDLTAMDVELSQQQGEEATVSLIYDDVVDYKR